MANRATQSFVAGDREFDFTEDYIAYHAALNPSDIALIDNDKKVTYAEFHRHLGGFIQAVGNFGMKVGDTAAIEWTSLYPQWLLLLACESHGIATYSYVKSGSGKREDVLAGANLVICTEGHVPPAARRVQLISSEWFDEVAALEPGQNRQRPNLPPDTALGIYFSSGTTGDAKRVVQVARVHENRIFKSQIRAGFNRQSRFLVWPTFVLQGIYIFANACIRMGGTCIYENTNNIAQPISRNDVTHISVVPSVLANLLDSLPNKFVKPKNLTVFTFGGPASDALRARAASDLEATLIENYSTNEAGPIGTIGRDGEGVVSPGVEVEIVDDDHRPVIGEPGRVRVKSGGCIDG